LGTPPLPIGKWGTSNLILVQQKDAPRVKIKRDTCGKCGRHPFSKEEQRWKDGLSQAVSFALFWGKNIFTHK